MCALLAAAIAAQNLSGSAEMTVYYSGSPAGTAKVSYKFTDKRTKLNQTRLEISVNGVTLKVAQESEYAQDGSPIRASIRTVSASKTASSSEYIEVNFAGRSAKITSVKDGTRTSKTVPADERLELRRKDEFWFISSRPAEGQIYNCAQLDFKTLQWKSVTCQYLGVERITIAGNRLSAHHVKTNQYDSWLDDKGVPLRIKDSNLVLERK